MVVNDYLESQFEPIMDYNFTANVEKEFDRIADGEITWNSMIDDFYGPFHKMVDHATTTQTTKNNQIRILGTDPTTGHTVKPASAATVRWSKSKATKGKRAVSHHSRRGS